jgi:dTDP-4-dehydrorhamnose reductase
MDSFLILGGNSKLARTFNKIYKKKSFTLAKNECDITNTHDIETVLKHRSESYVVNCAAITDIDYCEQNKRECFEINTIAAKSIESICKKYNKKFIQISSDYAVYPTNTYGLSKYILERILDLDESLIIRTSFFDEKYFLVKNLINNNVTDAYENVFFNPISSVELVKQIYINRDVRGILNIFSSKKISKYQFAVKIAETFNINANLIKKHRFVNRDCSTLRPFNSYVKPDIKKNLDKDLRDFKIWLDKNN